MRIVILLTALLAGIPSRAVLACKVALFGMWMEVLVTKLYLQMLTFP